MKQIQHHRRKQYRKPPVHWIAEREATGAEPYCCATVDEATEWLIKQIKADGHEPPWDLADGSAISEIDRIADIADAREHVGVSWPVGELLYSLSPCFGAACEGRFLPDGMLPLP